MKNALASLIFLLSITGAAEAQLLVRYSTWSVSGGADAHFPLIGHYYDFSVVKGADYFWEYAVNPQTALGCYAQVASVRPLHSRKHPGYISYGIGYRQLVRKMEFSGWEGGGISGVYNQGEGSKQWNDHYISFSAAITHQFFLGLKRKIILNSLGLSAGFGVYEQERMEFSGSSTYTDGTVVINALGYNRQGVSNQFFIPQVHLNYELGYVIPAGRSVIIPHLFVPVLNLNNYLQKYEPRNSPLKMRKEYYKEVMIGVTFMRASLK